MRSTDSFTELPATGEPHIFTNTEIIEWPGVKLIMAECIEHRDGDTISLGCGMKRLSWKAKEQPTRHRYFGEVEKILTPASAGGGKDEEKN